MDKNSAMKSPPHRKTSCRGGPTCPPLPPSLACLTKTLSLYIRVYLCPSVVRVSAPPGIPHGFGAVALRLNLPIPSHPRLRASQRPDLCISVFICVHLWSKYSIALCAFFVYPCISVSICGQSIRSPWIWRSCTAPQSTHPIPPSLALRSCSIWHFSDWF